MEIIKDNGLFCVLSQHCAAVFINVLKCVFMSHMFLVTRHLNNRFPLSYVFMSIVFFFSSSEKSHYVVNCIHQNFFENLNFSLVQRSTYIVFNKQFSSSVLSFIKFPTNCHDCIHCSISTYTCFMIKTREILSLFSRLLPGGFILIIHPINVH